MSESLQPMISVCAWCQPASASKKTAANVTHGICRRHFRRFLYKFRGSRPKVLKRKPWGLK